MDLSIVVVNWNACGLLRNCLRSIEARTAGVSHDVWVVDNASADGSVAMVAAEFPRVRIIRNAANIGYGAASNQGLRVTTGRYLLVTNADVEFVNHGIAAMVRYLDQHAKVAALGCKHLNADGSLQPSCFHYLDAPSAFGIATGFHNLMPYAWLSRSNPDGGLRRFFRFPDHDRVQHPDWFRAACVMLRREALAQTGGYDESFYMYCEEIDLFRRLKKRGWEIAYTPEAEAIHHGEASASQAARAMAVEFWKSMFRLSAKFPDETPSAPALWVAMMLGTLIRLVANVARMAARAPRAAERFRACGSILKWGMDIAVEGV